MASPYGPMLLIANPTAGRGRGSVLDRLTAALKQRGLDHDVELTRRRGDATGLARQAVNAGVRFVVAVGGDGTVHEVVNGLVDAELGPRAEGLVFGAVPAGSGCDFVRTFGLDRSPEALAKHLDGDVVYPIDIGRVRLMGRDGEPKTLCFANIAEVGYGAVVVERAERMPRWLGRTRYLLGVFAAIRKFGTTVATVTVDQTELRQPICLVVVANGQFFGGNMKVAPRALPDDGRYNVQVYRGKARDVFLMTPKIMRGEHLPHEDINEYQSARVVVESDRPMLVEADGEVIGRTPAEFDLFPKALAFKI